MSQEIKYLGMTALVIFAFLFFFTHSFSAGLKLGFAVVMLWLVPGYTLLHFAFSDLDALLKAVLAVFLGFGITALALYYLNVIGFASIAPAFSYAIGIFCLLLLCWSRMGRKKRGQKDVQG